MDKLLLHYLFKMTAVSRHLRFHLEVCLRIFLHNCPVIGRKGSQLSLEIIIEGREPSNRAALLSKFLCFHSTGAGDTPFLTGPTFTQGMTS